MNQIEDTFKINDFNFVILEIEELYKNEYEKLSENNETYKIHEILKI